MRVGLAIILNILLVLGLGYWLRREYRRAPPRLRRWLLPGLGLRLAAGLLGGGLDSRFATLWAAGFTARFWERPGAGWALWQGHELRIGTSVMPMYEWSNTLFIIKVLALLNFASLGAGWLNSLYLSAGCFAGCWVLVRTLGRLFPAAPVGAGVGAFLLWPSVVWWTSGLTKETLVLGSGAALTALVLNWLYGLSAPARFGQRLSRALLAMALAWFHLRMRYFFALPLLGSLLALAGVVAAERRHWLRPRWGQQALALLAGLGLGGGVVLAVGGEPVSRAFVTSQLWQSYTHGLATSQGRPHLAYPSLQPTVPSMAAHAPLAAAQTIVRPWLGESAVPRYLGAGLENLLLLGLLGLAAWAAVRGRPGPLPPALVLALLLYCVVLAALIGLSTPNLGTLHRYRAVLLPWLVWLLLQNDYARQLLRRLGG
ncbi:MAG: hypothetical protein ACRYG7_19355 [Janthinobacterium lividum]